MTYTPKVCKQCGQPIPYITFDLCLACGIRTRQKLCASKS
jgi:predicted amidophosphoribosyltransferase